MAKAKTSQRGEAENLEDLLAELRRAAETPKPKVTVENIMDAVGRRSFGPLLLLAGLLGMSPVAAIPTAPTIIAVITILVAGQLLIGRHSFWLPKALLNLSVKAERVKKTAKMAEKPARFIDRLVKRRLEALTKTWADRLVALACVLIALAVPPLELLPLAAIIPSAAIAVFGLGLIARDGLLVLLGLLISAGVVGLIGYQLLG